MINFRLDARRSQRNNMYAESISLINFIRTRLVLARQTDDDDKSIRDEHRPDTVREHRPQRNAPEFVAKNSSDGRA